MFTSLGFRAYGYVDPTPDIAYPLGALNGATGRVFAHTPIPKPERAVHFLEFCKKEIPKLWGKMHKQSFMSVEDWIDASHYTLAQKEQLRELYIQMFPDEYRLNNSERMRQILEIHSFIKKEFYPEFKMFRAILGRNDLSKLMLGCLVKSMEHVIYKSKHIIKHIPWHDRPAFMRETMSKYRRFINCDFSSYEASIKTLLCAAELSVYEHVADRNVARIIRDALYKHNFMKFSYFSASMPATRASGDVTTASGNVVITILVWRYVLQESNIDIYDMVAEGDDNQVGTCSTATIRKEIFEELGLIAKIEETNNYSMASFCGMIFPEFEDKIITDPIKVLNRFAWVDSKYINASPRLIMSLYRGKALCLLYQYRDCPILASFARAVLRCSRAITSKVKMSDKHWLNLDYVPTDEARLPKEEVVSPESRILVEELYKISSATQIQYENFFNSCDQPFEIPDYGIFNDVQSQNWLCNTSSATLRPGKMLPYCFPVYIDFVNFCSINLLTVVNMKKLIYKSEDSELGQYDPLLGIYQALPIFG